VTLEARCLAVLPGETGSVRLIEAPMPPAPADDQVRVRMLRAPINPADLLAIDGRYSFELAHDIPLGAEGCGVVEAVGANVTDLVPGDSVMALPRGNWCRYRTLRRSDLIALPRGIDVDQAAMLRINPPTALLLLRSTGVGPGDVIVQNAAASAVATWLRVIAASLGVTVIDILRRPAADLPQAIIDGEGLADRVKAAVAGRPVRAAFDCVAGEASGRMAECLSAGGRLVLFGHLSGEPIRVRSQLLTGGGLSISGFSLRPAEAAMGGEGMRAMFAELLALHAQAGPTLPVREVAPLSRAGAAIASARGGGRGRVLLDLTA